MRLLTYYSLDLSRVGTAFAKVKAAIEADDFRTADVKKLHSDPTGTLYRARLDYANRLLLKFARVPRPGDARQPFETVCLALEVIEGHRYDRSRFLRGATVDESRVEREHDVESIASVDPGSAIRWLGERSTRFEMFESPIVFDDDQQCAIDHSAPLVVIGAAGSGKTAVVLSRLRGVSGRVLYVTLSPYLARRASELYTARGFQNSSQQADFRSFADLLSELRAPRGRDVTLADFTAWCERQHRTLKQLGDLNSAILFEEFRGVLGAQPQGPLNAKDYLALGVRQSLIPAAARAVVHQLFERYRQWLGETGQHDSNLEASAWLGQPQRQGPRYDFIVADEVQDLTLAQLSLLIALLKEPGQFILVGDAHQVVHPSHFTWSAVKSMFWQGLAGQAAQAQPVRVLKANFRNTVAITELANRLLRVKAARFGAVDRESTYEVCSVSSDQGQVRLLESTDASLAALADATSQSARHAVIVFDEADRDRASKALRTPLVFTVHEAKGLEYENVTLFEMVSGYRKVFARACEGVTQADLQEQAYSRARDKFDKSGELSKRALNMLYVSITRSIKSLTLVERDVTHPLLRLLGLGTPDSATNESVHVSTSEEWEREAAKLEAQEKVKQASAIRKTVLRNAEPASDQVGNEAPDAARPLLTVNPNAEYRTVAGRPLHSSFNQEPCVRHTHSKESQFETLADSTWSLLAFAIPDALTNPRYAKGEAPYSPTPSAQACLAQWASWHGMNEWLVALADSGYRPATRLMISADSASPPGLAEFAGAGTWETFHERTKLPHPTEDAALRSPQLADALRRKAWQSTEHYRAEGNVLEGQWREAEIYSSKPIVRPDGGLEMNELFGGDHATVDLCLDTWGISPLMMCAAGGHVEQVKTLLDQGADQFERDFFGHTAWDHVLSRILHWEGTELAGFPLLCKLLAPQAIELYAPRHIGGPSTCVLRPNEPEYWIFSLMVAGFKSQNSRCWMRSFEPSRYAEGFFAEQFVRVLSKLPRSILPQGLGSSKEVQAVLESNCIGSGARLPLWTTESGLGFYPRGSLRYRLADGSWTPLRWLLSFAWVILGTDPSLRRVPELREQRTLMETLPPGPLMDQLMVIRVRMLRTKYRERTLSSYGITQEDVIDSDLILSKGRPRPGAAHMEPARYRKAA